MRNFMNLLRARWDEKKFVCVGLDSDYDKIPECLCHLTGAERIVAFNKAIIDATAHLACAYKPNRAFYESRGLEGIEALIQTSQYARERAPHVAFIYDAKIGDIGKTNLGYVRFCFDEDKVNADAVTVHGYLGKQSLKPLLDMTDKGIIALARTSNPGGGEFQDLLVDGTPFYLVVADHVANQWNDHGNCAVVAGATYPEELGKIRKVVADLPMLIPGIGTQGGDLEAAVKLGRDSCGQGMIINSSSGIIFGSNGEDFAEVAQQKTTELHRQILGHLAD